MKTILLFLSLLPVFVFGQQTTENIQHDGKTRQFIKYIPASYDGSTPVPVIFSLHGLGDNMNNFSNVGFHQIAEAHNVIVITPVAVVDPLMSATAWYSGTGFRNFVLNGEVHDIVFISKLVDLLYADTIIALSTFYATGFSMGGFMSNRLACELNGRIAAIASVAGTIGNGIDCNPGRAVPVCHFHGTADETVAYEGNNFGNDAEQLFEFWANNNSCSTTTDSLNIEDSANDGITVTKFERTTDCDDNAETVLYKANGAEHTWLFTPNNDIDYTTEIWNFFSNLSHPNPSSSIKEIQNAVKLSLYPNPVENSVTIKLPFQETTHIKISITELLGKLLLR